jgi:N-acetylglucosamine kinase-like BadF-type ATPase
VIDVVVGLDIGGTKTALVAETVAGEPAARTEVRSYGWSASPAGPAAAWIAQQLRDLLPAGRRVVALGVGAQGCDTNDHCQRLAGELARLGLPAVVVNDAALLVPAAGLARGIAVVSGTGAIGVGQDARGRYLFAGGWGWVLGDDAGAAGLVREATRAALAAHDAGHADDGLLAALQDAFGVTRPDLLARAVNDVPTMDSWGPRAPVVFEAADRGSARAVAVIEAGARHLVELVTQLVGRGAVGADVVAAGSVIVHQPRLFSDFRRLLEAAQPALVARLLDRAPVDGALALARRLRPPGGSVTCQGHPRPV